MFWLLGVWISITTACQLMILAEDQTSRLTISETFNQILSQLMKGNIIHHTEILSCLFTKTGFLEMDLSVCMYTHVWVCVCVCWACMNVWASALKITGQDTGKTVMLGYSRHHTRWESGSRQVSLQPQLHLLFFQTWTGLQFPRASEALRGSKSAFNNHTSG